MRQKTIVKTYLTFNELTDEQKAKVIEKNRDINASYDQWYDSVEEDFHEILHRLGFDISKSYFTGFWSQGDGASFEGSFNAPRNKDDLQSRIDEIKDFAPEYLTDQEIADFLALDFTEEIEEGQSIIAIYQIGRYYHSGTMQCDHEKLQAFARSLADKYYNDLSECYEHLTSDEQIAESLEANEYEFDADTLEIV